jgi:hypothetical protein
VNDENETRASIVSLLFARSRSRERFHARCAIAARSGFGPVRRGGRCVGRATRRFTSAREATRMVRLRSRARVGGRDVLFSRVRREKADVSAREATPSREVRFYHHLAKNAARP